MHKPTGQARARLHGRDIYLGVYNTDESRARYDALISEWLAAGRTLPAEKPSPPHDVVRDEIESDQDDAGLTIAEIVAAYWDHLNDHYGTHKGSVADAHKPTLRALNQLYGDLPVAEFGPRKLLAMQRHFIETGVTRAYVNRHITRIKKLFRWAVSRELIDDPRISSRLDTVENITAGRAGAKESRKVLPVSDAVVNQTLPHLTPTLQAMVKTQQLTGMRPGEVCQLRPSDIDRSSKIWIYKPVQHKNKLRGKDRAILIGPAHKRYSCRSYCAMRSRHTFHKNNAEVWVVSEQKERHLRMNAHFHQTTVGLTT